MRIAMYVETDEDGPAERELLLTIYVDDGDTPHLRRHEQLRPSDVPSAASQFLADVLGSEAPTG